MKVRILGCGTSTGVPKIGNKWGLCDPDEPRNARLRTSIMVESGGQRMLVDCGPDLRQQLLAAGVDRLDGLIVTHAHGDHCHGLDELRPVAQATGGPVPLHARRDVLDELKVRFGYAFDQSDFYRPIVQARELGTEVRFGDARVSFVDQPHGGPTSLGLRFDEGGASVGYAVDFSDLSEDMAALYQRVDVWIADCLTRKPHPTHMHLDGVLGFARELGVGELYLVHMGNGLDYRTLVAELPDWAAPAYDGLEIDLGMTNNMMLGGLYLLMAAMLVAGALITRREPAAKLFTIALAWIAIFAGGFILFTFRDNLGWVAQRLKAEAVGTPVSEGQETRIPMAIDGHFWVDARLNGRDVKFLVDSGATTTTIGRDTARRSGVEMSGGRDQYVRTGNGVIRVASGRATELSIGSIVRRDVALEIADSDDLNVLGMNYLSSLRRWSVEGRWLVLVS